MKNFEIIITDAKLYERKVSEISFSGSYVKVFGWGMFKNISDRMLAMDGHEYKKYGFQLIQK